MTTISDAGVAPGAASFGVAAANFGLSQSQVNSFRISAVVDALASRVSGPEEIDAQEFSDLCLSLSRGIDFAISHHEFPTRAQELPSLLKQVCEHKRDPRLLASVSVLMISVKNACQKGWFSESDSRELINLGSEAAKEFGIVNGFSFEPCHSGSIISTVISRFYPKMKIHHLFACMEVKAGFDAYLLDFLVEKDGKTLPGSKISLFVVQTDNLEASSCLITPPKVNFLLNGHGVENRTSIYMDPGPQLTTTVTPFLRYGSNLLQAVGEFNGNYIIAIAHMSEVPYPCSAGLKDYEQLAPVNVDTDSEIIEGPSRVSINCPISFKRIKTPVKGNLCKHIQCFDYLNYMEMNSRRPSWRCPHCNQSVSFTDIRVDQKMVEILKGVGATVSEIIFNSNGSWSEAPKCDGAIQMPENEISELVNEESSQPIYVLDLDNTDDMPVCLDPSNSLDRKHVHTATQDHVDDDFWSTIYLSTLSQGTMSLPLDHHNAHSSVAESNPMALFHPTLDSFNVNTAHADAPQVSNLANTSVMSMVNQLPNTSWLHHHLGTPTTTNESGRFSSMPRHMRLTPGAVQAVAAQTSASISQQRSRTPFSNNMSTAVSVTPQVSTSQSMISNQPASYLAPRVHSLPQYSRSPAPHLAQPRQSASLNPPFLGTSEHQWQNQPMMTPVNSFAGHQHTRPSMQSSTRFASAPKSSVLPRNAIMGSEASTTPIAHMNSRNEPVVVDRRLNDGVPRSDVLNPTDMNWRPTGKMRGAFSGQAYAEMYKQVIGRTQQAQTPRPLPPPAQPFIADRAAASARPPASAGRSHFSSAAQPLAGHRSAPPRPPLP